VMDATRGYRPRPDGVYASMASSGIVGVRIGVQRNPSFDGSAASTSSPAGFTPPSIQAIPLQGVWRAPDVNRRLSHFWPFTLRVLVASPFRQSLRQKPCETAGENVTETKHGFEPTPRIGLACGARRPGQPHRLGTQGAASTDRRIPLGPPPSLVQG